MTAPKRDEEREELIAMEVVVDCYNEHETRSGWWCCLDDKLAFPFQAKWVKARRGSPLKIGERAAVTGMLDDETQDTLPEMHVMIAWQGRTLGVPLAQLVGAVARVGVSGYRIHRAPTLRDEPAELGAFPPGRGGAVC